MTVSSELEFENSDTQFRWDLSRLYDSPDDPRIEADLREARRQAKVLHAAYGGLVADIPPAEIRNILDSLDQIASLLARLFGYAYLLFSADTQTEDNKRLYARIQSEVPDIQQETRAFELELQRLPQEAFDALIHAPELATYAEHLKRLRRLARYALDEAAEKILALKEGTSSQAWVQLYFETTADFRIRLGLENYPEEMTLSEAYALRETGHREERKLAFESTLMHHAENSRVLSAVYGNMLENWRHNMVLRQYNHPLAPLLIEENLTADVIETLLQTVESNYALVQRYFWAKARVLGLEDFSSHDIRANYGDTDGFISYEEARDIVIDTFTSFSEELGDVTQGFFNHRYIDAFSRSGKRSGAYCLSAGPVFHPYLFLNYNFTLKDVITMAHELGHGVHNVVAGRHHNITNSDRVTLFMETPSTFAETLVAQRLLAREVQPEARLHLLGTQIESAILKIFKSVALTRFQLNAYERRRHGVVPVNTYCAMWEEQVEAMYGTAVQRGAWDRWEWLTFSHVLSHPFYDYAYSFGQLLVYVFVREFQQKRTDFAPRFLSLLEAGTSLTIGDLLKRVDIDIKRASLWQEGLAHFEQLVEEFEDLAENHTSR